MQAAPDEQFHAERRRFHLRFTCEDCAYFDPTNARCSHGYPDAMHRAAAFEPGAAVEAAFCKEHELG